jgi:hypothetical protein
MCYFSLPLEEGNLKLMIQIIVCQFVFQYKDWNRLKSVRNEKIKESDILNLNLLSNQNADRA